MFPTLQRDGGPFLVSIGAIVGPNPSVGVVVAVPVLSNENAGTPTSDGTTDALVDTTVGNGTLYWAVVLDGDSATDQQVKYGGGEIIVHGSQSVSGTGTQTVSEISGLVSNTAYTIIFLQTNSIGSDSAQGNVALTTDEVTLTSPSDGTPTSDGATGAGVTTNTGNGTLYWAVVTDGGSATDAEIKAGTGGDIVPGVADNQAVSADGAQTIEDITGLDSSTTYAILYLQTDRSGNDSAQSSVALTTTS